MVNTDHFSNEIIRRGRVRFTVFTPTYNRAYTIEKLYESLKRQTFHSFEWIVIDDGSTDNTGQLIKQWITQQRSFKISYCFVEHGGKHRAINKALESAQGDLFLIVDSDDYLTDDALSIMDSVEKSISKQSKSEFCAISGCDGYSSEERVGKTIKEGTGKNKRWLDITNL